MMLTSPRERRLWLAALAAVVLIWSTLGLARVLAGELRDAGWLAATFTAGCLLVVAAVVLEARRRRWGGYEAGVLVGLGAITVLLFTRMATIEERSHVIEYGVVALLIYEALDERARQGRRVPLAPLVAIASASLVGVVDETLQLWIPTRTFDPVDMLFNTSAAVMAVVGRVALGARRQTGAT